MARQPVWIINRTPEMLAALSARREGLLDPDSTAVQQPEYARNTYRSIKQNILVLVGICTHLGCSPKFLPAVEADWDGGFLCACHGSRLIWRAGFYRRPGAAKPGGAAA